MARPEPTWVFHFTRVKHLASIIEHGLVSDSLAHATGRLQVEVGNREIKSARARRAVPVAPGGVVADNVPFSYCPRSPMLSSVATDARIGAMTRWDVMRLKYWREAPDGDELRQAECLVHERVPLAAIPQIGVKTRAVLAEVQRVLATMGATGVGAAVRPGWYF